MLHLSAFDRRGGAAIAAPRLQQGLRACDVERRMLVQFRSGDDPNLHAPEGKWPKEVALFRDTVEPLPLSLYRRRSGSVFSPNWLPYGMARGVAAEGAEIVYPHWAHAGVLSPSALRRFQRPIVWTLHDMWPFTGGATTPVGARATGTTADAVRNSVPPVR